MYTLFVIAAVVALSFQSLLLYLAFFGPRLPYRVKEAPDLPIDSDEFCGLLSTITDAQLYSGNRIEVITNGENFYPAEIEAIQSAQKTVNLEAFIYYKGEIAKRYVDALAERARAGVKVKVIIDFLEASARTAATSVPYWTRAVCSSGITRRSWTCCRR